MALLKDSLEVGMTTREIDSIAEQAIYRLNAKPSFKHYNGFPASACISINEQVVHGIPGGRKLMDGDLVSIDIGLVYQGYHADMARTFGVGNVSSADERLMEITCQSFYAGIKMAKIGNRIGDIGEAIQKKAESEGYSIVRELTGHGIGRKLHEDPAVPNYGKAGSGVKLQDGLVIAIEPMVNAGKKQVRVLGDGWTVITADGKKSAHYENTVVITPEGPKLLTHDEVEP